MLKKSSAKPSAHTQLFFNWQFVYWHLERTDIAVNCILIFLHYARVDTFPAIYLFASPRTGPNLKSEIKRTLYFARWQFIICWFNWCLKLSEGELHPADERQQYRCGETRIMGCYVRVAGGMKGPIPWRRSSWTFYNDAHQMRRLWEK